MSHVVLPQPVLTNIGPMALLADSQLLFGGEKGEPLSQWVMGQVAARYTAGELDVTEVSKKAVYIGAANGNVLEFYEMAVDICRQWGIDSVDAVVRVKNAKQLITLSAKDIAVVILAGGDVALGWSFLSQPSVRGWLDYYTQTSGLIIGISAGAIHLASSFSKDHNSRVCFLEYCSVNIAAHEELEGWPTVRLWQQSIDNVKSLFVGLPLGGGMLVEPNAFMLKGVRSIGKGFSVFEKYAPIA